jgi:putative DNA primase/helicase
MDEKIIRLANLQESGKDRSTSEDAMALEFASRHVHELRYVAPWGRWLAYDGTRWARDETLHVFDRARLICRETAAGCEKANGIASAKTVVAVEKLARADRRLAATTAQWDAVPWCLTTGDDSGEAATFDLRTGIERPCDPLDFITKGTACMAAPRGTPHPLWSKFLNRVTNGDADLQAFLQRYVGYCLTGITSEHAFVFAYGTGSNGKSTFINTVANIFGDYATIASMATFIATKVEQHPTDLAKLMGARLVVAMETQKGRRWDEIKIKALTGGDKITARFMRQDFFDYTPAFKLLIAGNNKPRLTTVDEAMRRRLLLVPFTVRISPAERDPRLPAKLKAEWPAILRWAIDGCLEWQRIGLNPPSSVQDATDAYFHDQDTVGQWLEDCTKNDGELAFTRTAELFASWKGWCEACNIKPGSEMAFSTALAERGFKKKRNGAGQQGFRALAVKP